MADLPPLLPAGIYDLLPPAAELEAALVSSLLSTLSAHGYERVEPPLVEFEETLLSGAGRAMATAAFRMMDPLSHRMIGVRADMTPQIARLAATRLGAAPRPLRLSYAGEVLRTRASELFPERQFGQVGAELIGAQGVAADVEVIAVAGESLAAIGVEELSVDLTLPTLVPSLVAHYRLAVEPAAALRQALDRKDAAAVKEAAGERAADFARLLGAAGPAEPALAALEGLALPPSARAEVGRLAAVRDGLKALMPEIKLTIDPVENRGFEYHTGISFAFFTGRGARLGELGRGGRYEAGEPDAGEPATGFTLYTDRLLPTLPEARARPRLLLPLATERARAKALREAGWITLAALEPCADWRAEARRLRCLYLLEGGVPVKIDA
jgi:ATP phosphoribosyltransferase regulatory subunit